MRPCPVRDGLRPSRQKSQIEYDHARIAAGKCVNCRAARVTERYCRRCADKHAARQRRYKRETA